MLLALALLAGSVDAHAVPFPRKTQQEAWPERQVDREETLPRGWLQAELRLDHKATGRYRDFDGSAVAWDPAATWRYSRATLVVEQGFSRHTRFTLRVPWVWAHLTNDNGADIGTFALGDASCSALVQPWLDRRWKLAFSLDLKAPSGVEWPGSFASGPDTVTGFLTGTGITNLGGNVHGAVTLGTSVRLGLRVGYTHKFAGIVGYVVEQDGFANGWVDPGDALDVVGEVQLQLVDGFALAVVPSVSRRGLFKTGVSGSGNRFDEWDYTRDPGLFVDVAGRLDWDPDETWGFTIEGGAQAVGTETRSYALLGLEEFSPQPGAWLGLRGRVRL